VEDFVESVTRGNPTEVKVVLASVVAALAVYQLALIAVGYRRLRLPFLEPRPASLAHRASGDAIVLITVIVAIMCVSVFGFAEDEGTLHTVAGVGLLVALALKVAVVRWWHGLGRFLPLIGTAVFVLMALTWASSAGHFLVDR
jgi:hypothetical protein